MMTSALAQPDPMPRSLRRDGARGLRLLPVGRLGHRLLRRGRLRNLLLLRGALARGGGAGPPLRAFVVIIRNSRKSRSHS
ncbi:hypothetical protein [Nocardia abscessus]|uniref:hypothetical protein n=1 Tax=Nocardia abscessus TaxID=120957 RepID=UPI00245872FB|nr:hypothetical protein [Nocardia abscessus]